MPDDLMTVGEARAFLRVSRNKVAELIRDGVLATERDPLDKRLRLVKRADVEALRERSVKNAA